MVAYSYWSPGSVLMHYYTWQSGYEALEPDSWLTRVQRITSNSDTTYFIDLASRQHIRLFHSLSSGDNIQSCLL